MTGTVTGTDIVHRDIIDHESGRAVVNIDHIDSEMSIDDLVAQVTKIQSALKVVMHDGEHYGVIPGTGSKPTLLKPGAEKLCLLFRLAPEYVTKETFGDDRHFSARVTCRLTHIPSGSFVGSGEAICTTREAKYAWRSAGRKCPVCGATAIIKGRAEYGGGWFCFKKKEGCGSKFNDGDAAIESQSESRQENPDLPDTYNTVLKMACKRALVAAVLNATAASDIFTQDLEDTPLQPGKTSIPPGRLAASPETLSELERQIEYAQTINPTMWATHSVVATARKKFGPHIKTLRDTTEDEANTIVEGLISWMEKNQPPRESSPTPGKPEYIRKAEAAATAKAPKSKVAESTQTLDDDIPF